MCKMSALLSLSAALVLCGCIVRSVLSTQYDWVDSLRFDFYLTETDRLWLSLWFFVCAKMTVNMPRLDGAGDGDGALLVHFLQPKCAHIHFNSRAGLLQMRISVL